MEELSSACTSFALDLFKTLSQSNPAGNMFYSPISISTAVAMIYMGTQGKTAEQISKTLHIDGIKDLPSKYQSLNDEIKKKSNSSYDLLLANQLFGEQTFSFLPEFLSSLQNFYHAKLGTVDFITAWEAARKEINTWVSEQTKGKISEVLPAGSVDASTRLVLVNAIYFKGDWAEKFSTENTKEMPFRLSKNDQKPVKMMYQLKKFPFGHVPEVNSQILELPYDGHDLSMVILLPDDIEDDTTGLQKLEKELTLEKLQEWTGPENMYPTDVHVYLPKFQLEDSYMLQSPLSILGMVDVFDEGRADLSGMSSSGKLYLSDVIHKAFLEVNEEGAEAVAATAGIAMTMSLPREEQFKADHPFMCIIRHNKTRNILFLGRVSAP